MELTYSFLQEKFMEFNKRFFANELPIIPIHINRTRRQFGAYHFSRDYFRKETPDKITISNYYDRTEKEYCETLIHEMIHYFMSIKNIDRNGDPHGYYFIRMAKEISNKSEYNISIHSSSEGKISRAAKRGKQHVFVVFEYKGKTYVSKVARTMTQDKISSKFIGVKFIKFMFSTAQEAEKLICRNAKLSLFPYNEEFISKYKLTA